MKVLYMVHQYFPRHLGGTEVFTRGLATRAAKAGHQVLVLCCHEAEKVNRPSAQTFETSYDDVAVKEIHFNLSDFELRSRCEYDNEVVGKEVEKTLCSFQPDIVHVMHPMKLSHSALDACSRNSIPFIVSLCDFWLICPRHSLLTWDNKLCSGPDQFLKCTACLKHLHGYPESPNNLQDMIKLAKDLTAIASRKKELKSSVLKAKRIVALSEFQKRIFLNNGYPSSKIEVMQHGIETKELDQILESSSKLRKPHAPSRLGFIGSIVAIKGLHVLTEALKLSKTAELELHVYGKIPDNEYGQAVLNAAEADPRIMLKGTFPPEKLGEVLLSIDALLLPALWYENEPIVVKAAQYMGVPVVLSKLGSLVDMVENETNGILVEAANVEAWAEAITRAAKGNLPKPDAGLVKSLDTNALAFFEMYKQEAG